MDKVIKAGILGGIVLFIWGFISWTVIPWHTMILHTFSSDVAVSQMIQANAPMSGVYILPSMQEGTSVAPGQPMIFASINLNGMPSSMIMQMVISLVTQIIAAFLVAWLLSKTIRLNYLARVAFVVGVALTATLICNIPAWNWFGFDINYTAVMIADILIGWLLAGLVIARFVTTRLPH